jgi:two-component system, NtrC family, sensor kinase
MTRSHSAPPPGGGRGDATREHDSQDRVAISSVPVSREVATQSGAPLAVPARWLDTLLVTGTTLPVDHGEAAVAEQIVKTVAALLPEWAVGARLVAGKSSPRVIKLAPAGEEHRAAGIEPARLFPGYLHERVYEAESDRVGWTLHVAGDDPAIDDPDAPGNFLAVRAAQMMRRGLFSVRRCEAAERTSRELRELSSYMVQAEKLASVGQIAAGIVHELNNPLTSIVAYTDYLTRRAHARGADADDLERLRRIRESAGRMLRFTRDLVAYARPSSETPVVLSLHTVIDRALAFCEHVLEESGVTVERCFAPDLPAVRGVPEELAQVFVNLVTNACHAMAPFHGRLIVRTERLEGAVRVVVEDNGHGIPEESLPQIFAPFFTTKPDGRGTGLGLSIVKSIVDNHEGEIRAEAVSPRGARFVVELPVRVNQADRDSPT